LNDLSVQSLAETGIDISGERPKAITDEMVRSADAVVTLGRESDVGPVQGPWVKHWDTDEPSERGFEGIERMRLIRDDIAARVRALAAGLGRSGLVQNEGAAPATDWPTATSLEISA